MKPPRRFSIAGLMTIVLVAATGLGALRSGSEIWAGGFYLLTYGVLLLAVVGAVCRAGRDRAWWLGFALFGLAYFRHLGLWLLTLPTTRLLQAIRPDAFGEFGDIRDPYWTVGHCLASLLAATLGGVLAGAIFGTPGSRPARVDLVFRVSNGMVFVTADSSDDVPEEVDHYLLAGHCVLALLAAGLGAVLVPLVSGRAP